MSLVNLGIDAARINSARAPYFKCFKRAASNLYEDRNS